MTARAADHPLVKQRANLLMPLAIVAIGTGAIVALDPPSSGSAASAEVKATVAEFVTAQDHGDGAAMCALLTPTAQQTEIRAAAILYHTGNQPCAPAASHFGELLSTLADDPGSALAVRARGLIDDQPVVTVLTVNGETATARSTNESGRSSNLTLVRSGGRWLITEPALPPAP